MYLCAVSYTGNNNPLDEAILGDVTFNGVTYSNPKALSDWEGIFGIVQVALSDASVSSSLITVGTNNTGQSANIALNQGEIFVLITVFYPSSVLTGSIEVTVNGTPQTFTFEKIATA